MTPTSSHNQLGDELLRLIARLNRWSSRHADTDLPLGQLRLLSLIDESGAARIGELAVAEGCTQPGMTQQVKRLEKLQLVKRHPDPTDARATLISVTNSGHQRLNTARKARAVAVAPIIGQLDTASLDDLQKALDTLSQLLTLTAGDTTPTHSLET